MEEGGRWAENEMSKCIDFHDKIQKRIRVDDGRGEEWEAD